MHLCPPLRSRGSTQLHFIKHETCQIELIFHIVSQSVQLQSVQKHNSKSENMTTREKTQWQDGNHDGKFQNTTTLTRNHIRILSTGKDGTFSCWIWMVRSVSITVGNVRKSTLNRNHTELLNVFGIPNPGFQLAVVFWNLLFFFSELLVWVVLIGHRTFSRIHYSSTNPFCKEKSICNTILYVLSNKWCFGQLQSMYKNKPASSPAEKLTAW